MSEANGHHSASRSAIRRRETPARLAFAASALLGSALLLPGCGRPAVDPALVGVWEMSVPGGVWRLSIDAAGHYQFTVDGASSAPAHDGAFTAHDGEWTLHATSMALDDHGRYEIGAGGAITLIGNRGALGWHRGTAPNGAAIATTPAPKPGTPAPPPPQAAKPVQNAAAPKSSGATLPDTIDPCLLVTAAEAKDLIGTTVEPERTTPQPHTQNDCRYRVKGSQRSVAITTYNGGGMDIAKYLANHASGSTPLEGIGDGAYLNYHAPTGLTAVNFVIGGATFEILVAGVPRAVAEPALRGLAATAAKRAVDSSAFQVPGLERFVGTWMSRVLGHDEINAVTWIERDGTLRAQGVDGFSGTMTVVGSSWRVDDPLLKTAPSGTLSFSGDQLTFRGEYLQAEMTRVPCGKSPSKVKPPYELTKLLAGRLNGKGLALMNPKADGTQFDARLAGLWEGEGKTTNGRSTQALVSLDGKGRGLFALFPVVSGKFVAADGNYKILVGGNGDMAGTYHFEGGVYEGLVQLVNGNETYEFRPYDPSKHPPYETPIAGHCR